MFIMMQQQVQVQLQVQVQVQTQVVQVLQTQVVQLCAVQVQLQMLQAIVTHDQLDLRVLVQQGAPGLRPLGGGRLPGSWP